MTRFSTAFFCLAAAWIMAFAAPAADGNGMPRIISLYAAHTEVLLRLGARDAVIGVSRQESYAGPETRDWQPPTFSIRDDVEKYLAAKPDIVLVRPQHIAGAGHIVAALERAGITVKALQVTQADELFAYWRSLAALVNKETECETLIADFSAAVDLYKRAAENRAHKPGVFIEAIHKEVKTFTPNSLPAWIVELAGGRYVAADAHPTTPGVIIANYGPERLLTHADEINIFISQSGAMNRIDLASVKERTIYQPLAAFISGRVYSMPESILARPTPSLLEGLAMIAEWTGLQPVNYR